jgi:hypothetical protein
MRTKAVFIDSAGENFDMKGEERKERNIATSTGRVFQEQFISHVTRRNGFNENEKNTAK